MANTQGLRRRIRSVKNTRQITKAMEMVAASKMRRAQEAAIQTRTYAHEALVLLNNLSTRTEGNLHPLLTQRPVKRILAVVIASDKGLCGGYNSQLLRTAWQFVEDNKDKEVDIVSIGRKSEDFFRRFSKNLTATFNNFPTYPTSLDILPVSKIAMDGFVKGEYDQVVMIFTNFISTLKQTPIVRPILPLSVLQLNGLMKEPVEDKKQPFDKAQGKEAYEYKFEPTPEKVLNHILPRLTEMQIFHAILAAIASEFSARMMAMKNASESATELIDDLTLTYNFLRQASITQELAEVNAGVEALK